MLRSSVRILHFCAPAVRHRYRRCSQEPRRPPRQFALRSFHLLTLMIPPSMQPRPVVPMPPPPPPRSSRHQQVEVGFYSFSHRTLLPMQTTSLPLHSRNPPACTAYTSHGPVRCSLQNSCTVRNPCSLQIASLLHYCIAYKPGVVLTLQKRNVYLFVHVCAMIIIALKSCCDMPPNPKLRP